MIDIASISRRAKTKTRFLDSPVRRVARRCSEGDTRQRRALLDKKNMNMVPPKTKIRVSAPVAAAITNSCSTIRTVYNKRVVEKNSDQGGQQHRKRKKWSGGVCFRNLQVSYGIQQHGQTSQSSVRPPRPPRRRPSSDAAGWAASWGVSSLVPRPPCAGLSGSSPRGGCRSSARETACRPIFDKRQGFEA